MSIVDILEAADPEKLPVLQAMLAYMKKMVYDFSFLDCGLFEFTTDLTEECLILACDNNDNDHF